MKKIIKYTMATLMSVILFTGTVYSQTSDTALVADSSAITTVTEAVVAETASTVSPSINTGDTAWMIVATLLVLMMTIPGLAFFYGGLVRSKNILSVLMQCFVLAAVITVEWVVIGYSMAFGPSEGFLKPFVGGFDWAFLNGISLNDISPYFISQSQPSGNLLADGSPEMVGTIPHFVFILFQCMFAIITPALIVGAFAERIKFRGFLIFSILWAIIVYNPIAHMVWSGDGWLFKMGALDFAGGTVVHINAGIAAIVMAIMIGKRKNYYNQAFPSHNIPFVVLGAALLWVGWFGFNAGSGLAADGLAASAFLVTHVAAAAAAFTWVIMDWIYNKKTTVIGIVTGAVGGLVAITPAAGFVDVTGALIIGLGVSVICFYMVGFIKPKLGYDDSLDAFGVHGIGGIFGALAVGLLATPAVQSSYSGLFYGNSEQFTTQLIATGFTIVYSGVLTFVLFKIVDKIFGIRATQQEESMGLDETQHHETAYSNID